MAKRKLRLASVDDEGKKARHPCTMPGDTPLLVSGEHPMPISKVVR